MSKRSAVNTVSDERIWVCEKGHVDDHHLDYGGICLTCLATGVGEHGEAPDPPCAACDGSGDATNNLCSRCGGKCTPFGVENKQLKRKEAE
jgi:hypothetical protein